MPKDGDHIEISASQLEATTQAGVVSLKKLIANIRGSGTKTFAHPTEQSPVSPAGIASTNDAMVVVEAKNAATKPSPARAVAGDDEGPMLEVPGVQAEDKMNEDQDWNDGKHS